MNRHNAIRSSLLALALVGVVAGTTLATPADRFVGTNISQGTMHERVRVNTHTIKLQTRGPVTFKSARVDIAPGGSSGWHTHPGIVLVTVQQGAVTFYEDDCSSDVHAAGSTSSSFVEAEGDGPGLARNEGAEAAIVYVTYVAPAATTVFRIDAANPGCRVS